MTNNKISKLKNIIQLYTNTETMTNNKKQTAVDFVPYELALELKQLGFDEVCIYHYKKNDEGEHTSHPTFEMLTPFGKNHNILDSRVSAPTYSQAFRWFRENYSLQGIIWSGKISTVFYGYNILNISKQKYIINNTELGGGDCDYETYEEAELGCLRHLIKTVKENENRTS
jgi:hypothetical protein